MNRLTQTIITRQDGKDEDITQYFSKGKPPVRHSADRPSCWTRFITAISSFFNCHCNLYSVSKSIKEKKEKFDLNLLNLPGSLSGIQDKDLYIIKGTRLPMIWIMSVPGALVEALVDRLAETYNFHHVNVGEMLQVEISLGTNQPELGKKLMERGVVIPRRFLNEMIKRNMVKALKEKEVKGFLFSDFPTTFTQAKVFIKTITDVDYIMVLKFDEQTMKLCAHNLLQHQTHSSKSVWKSKLELKADVDELITKHEEDLRSLYKIVGNKMQAINADMNLADVCQIIMKWMERAMIFHSIRPPQGVAIPVRDNNIFN